MIWLSLVALVCAALPALLYFRNVQVFRPPPAVDGFLLPSERGGRGGVSETGPSTIDSSGEGIQSYPPLEREGENPWVSVLIPARNEELSIRGCIDSVLASRHVELEVIVLDDASTDQTFEIVREIAATDARLRLETAPPLPEGWSGKQHACYTLAKHATMPILTFLDADVRLAPDALARMALFQRQSGAALVSGFPRQDTGIILEKLLIPLMHFLLLGFLPLARMRTHPQPSLGAGCGQWFLTTRAAYDRVGGHAAIQDSFHDGVKLPRAYRAAGMMTDLCDVTDLATCRMYRSAGQVWNGLAKNAREGLASPRLIVFTTTLLFCGQILPFLLLLAMVGLQASGRDWVATLFGTDTRIAAKFAGITAVACLLAFAPRIDAAARFHQSRLGAIGHPVAIVILLVIQWYSLFRAIIGCPVGWKGRPRPVVSPNN